MKPTGIPFDSRHVGQDYFWLPTDTPWGNMSLKLVKVEQRLGHANQRLSESYGHWELFQKTMLPGEVDHGAQHWLTAEEAVLMLRRVSDELVSLVWVLTRRLDDGAYPVKIAVDSIHSALDLEWPIFEKHRSLLESLNSISNAHKHSFLQSEVNIVGALEPCVASLAVTRNKLGADESFQVIALGPLAQAFTEFLRDVLARLRKLSTCLYLADGENQNDVVQAP